MGKLRQLFSTLLLLTVLTAGAFAQSNLTQIRDTIYNTNGTPFNGTIVVTWVGFSTPTSGSISPLSTSARIYNGALSVLLVPSTTAASGSYYQVVYYSSDATTTWTETWSVPPSTNALSVSGVRTSTTSGSGSSGSGSGGSGSGSGSGSTTSTQYATLPISITQVTGLSDDLNSIGNSIASLTNTVNGLSSAGAGASSTALASLTDTVTALNSTVSGLNLSFGGLSSTVTGIGSTVAGLTTTAAGNSTAIGTLNGVVSGLGATVTGLGSSLNGLNTTVSSLSSTVNSHGAAISSLNSSVNGVNSSVINLASTITSMQSGSSTVNLAFVDGETPAGTMDGTNTVFTISQSPTPAGSLELYRNGLVQTSGVDYVISGNTITFLAGNVPVANDTVQAYYRVVGTSPAPAFADDEVPGGTIDGSNLNFVLMFSPTPTISVKLYKNGILLQQHADYTLSGSTITFTSTSAPQPGDAIIAYYRH